MTDTVARIILGSRSPRRLELLRTIVHPQSIEVVPPLSSEEAGFDGLHDWPSIQARMYEIAQTKFGDVHRQLDSRPKIGGEVVVTADTAVVVADAAGLLHVLGQPPNDPSWRDVVRRWFREYYAGKTHTVATMLCVTSVGYERGHLIHVDCSGSLVKTEVTFCSDVDRWLEWYLSTDEPLGKAGGYAIQGAGSIFIECVEGSHSNVIGLPLRELIEILGPTQGMSGNR